MHSTSRIWQTAAVVASEIRWAVRSHVRRPWLGIACAWILALGIGVNAAVFAIVDRLLLSGPDYVQTPDRVVRVLFGFGDGADQRRSVASSTYPLLELLRWPASPFETVVGYSPVTTYVGDGMAAREVSASLVTGDFFRLFSVRPLVGRLIRSEGSDSQPAQDHVVLGEQLWRSAFGSDTAIVGKTIAIGGRRVSVIGVVPARMTGIDLDRVDAWLPISAAEWLSDRPDWAQSLGAGWLKIVARLPPGADPQNASSQATRLLTRNTNLAFPPWSPPPSSILLGSIVPGWAAERSSDVKVAIFAAIVALAVLLSSVANAGGLLVTRSAARESETSIRRALGMDDHRLGVSILVDTVLIGATSAVLALGLAALLRRSISHFLATGLGLPANVDSRIVVFILAATSASVVVIWLLQLVQVRSVEGIVRTRPAAGGSASPAPRFRQIFIAVQVAAAVFLVAFASMFIRSLRNVNAIDTGIDVDRVAMVSLTENVPFEVAVDRRLAVEELGRRLSAIPGVSGASVMSKSVPLKTAYGIRVEVAGRPMPRSAPGLGPYYAGVDANFFATSGMTILRGRAFTGEEDNAGARVAIVNETMAQRFWSSDDGLGACLLLGNDRQCTTVIGVSSNMIKLRLIGDPDPSMVFIPNRHYMLGRTAPSTVLLRLADGYATEGVLRSARIALHQWDPNSRAGDVTMLSKLLAPQLMPWQVGVNLFSFYGALALIISCVGVYSLVAYLAARRVREVGIRLALGATAAGIAGLIVRESLSFAFVGICCGLVVTTVTAQAAKSLFFGLASFDLVSLAAAAIAIVMVAISASLLPALRASRVDPRTAIQAE